MDQETNHYATLTQGRIGTQLIKLTLPMIWGLSALIMFNVVDTFFVGRLGKLELAAMSFTFPVVWVLVAVSVGIGIGASSTISRAIGSGDPQAVRRLTTDSLLLSLLVVGVLALVGILTIDPLFRAMGADDKTLPLIREYMVIWYSGVLFVVTPIVGNNAIRAAGNTLYPAIVMTVSGVVNAILDPILIFGLWGCPRLELRGAAIATVIGRAVSLTASLIILHGRLGMISFSLPRLRDLWASWKRITEIALPAAGTQVVVPVSMMVVTRLVALFGPEAVAGMGVATRLEGLAMIALYAIATVMTPYVGQNFGAGRFDRVDRSIALSYRFCLVWGLLTAVVLALCARPLSAVFNKDPDVIAVASWYLFLVPVSYGFQGVAFVTGSSFNARGKPWWTAVLVMVRMFVLYIPAAFLLREFFGYKGVFVAACLANIGVGLLGWFWNDRTDLR